MVLVSERHEDDYGNPISGQPTLSTDKGYSVSGGTVNLIGSVNDDCYHRKTGKRQRPVSRSLVNNNYSDSSSP